MKSFIANTWILWPRRLSDADCQRLIDETTVLSDVSADISRESKSFPEVRSSNVRWLYNSDSRWDWIWEVVNEHLDFANAHLGAGAEHFEPDIALQFTIYRAHNRGHYDWHVDSWHDFSSPTDRRLSLSIQLSAPTDYMGGELQIKGEVQPPPEQLAKRGSIFVFLSTTLHRIVPITDGLRYSLVAWKSGPAWRQPRPSQ